MQPIRTSRIADSADFEQFFGVSRETSARLAVYEKLLRSWQKTINLVAPSTLDDIWHRHFADSAQLVAVAETCIERAWERPVRWVDLGSGAGFPGLVVGMMWAGRGHMHLQLVDSDQRKAAFLREVVRETGLKAEITVDILPERIESAANHTTTDGTRGKAVDVVSARALAPLPKLLDWASLYFGPAVGLFLKGRDAALEVKAVGTEADWVFDFKPSVTDADGRVVVVRRQGSMQRRQD